MNLSPLSTIKDSTGAPQVTTASLTTGAGGFARILSALAPNAEGEGTGAVLGNGRQSETAQNAPDPQTDMGESDERDAVSQDAVESEAQQVDRHAGLDDKQLIESHSTRPTTSFEARLHNNAKSAMGEAAEGEPARMHDARVVVSPGSSNADENHAIYNSVNSSTETNAPAAASSKPRAHMHIHPAEYALWNTAPDTLEPSIKSIGTAIGFIPSAPTQDHTALAAKRTHDENVPSHGFSLVRQHAEATMPAEKASLDQLGKTDQIDSAKAAPVNGSAPVSVSQILSPSGSQTGPISPETARSGTGTPLQVVENAKGTQSDPIFRLTGVEAAPQVTRAPTEASMQDSAKPAALTVADPSKVPMTDKALVQMEGGARQPEGAPAVKAIVVAKNLKVAPHSNAQHPQTGERVVPSGLAGTTPETSAATPPPTPTGRLTVGAPIETPRHTDLPATQATAPAGAVASKPAKQTVNGAHMATPTPGSDGTLSKASDHRRDAQPIPADATHPHVTKAPASAQAPPVVNAASGNIISAILAEDSDSLRQQLAPSDSAGIEVSWDLRPAQTTTVTTNFAQPTAHRADIPAHVTQQIADAMRHNPDKPVEIKLNPVELGRVRMVLTPSEAGVTVSILADRSDTLDLMRRNIDDLGRSLADMGYEDISFSFGQDTSQHDADSDPDAQPDRTETTTILEDTAPQAHTLRPQNPHHPVDGIDIRL
ncbi:MAG: flagellar hook-length control protein FliK [Pseudomonadota bacterium]